MRRAVLAFAATVEGGGGALRDALVDANRLRRMDRFGRSGVLAGARALSAAGVQAAVPGAAPDPRFGVVVGTAFGCRDAMAQHERLLAAAARVEDLAPSVFAATVHNTVAGELAIGWGLGGPAETLVSGRTAGLEALVLAASRIAKGDADRILVVAAEGIDDAMREADATLVESSAAVLLEAEEEENEEEEISLSKRKRAVFVDAALTFDPDPQTARFEEKREDFLEGVGLGGARGGGGAVIERLGATGLWEIARDLAEPHSPSKKIRNRRYETRDAYGSCAAVTLAFFS
ncbi:MAG: beta-ketoacyl synthase chain length factor [Acidobacteria bacterium]|nr:beta-ketoacyl synthase chain length factor [Acidobacteriota bacterium]